MKKILLTCFLGGVCLFGSVCLAQVADSPPGVGLVSADSPYPGREEYSTPAHKGKDRGDIGKDGDVGRVEDGKGVGSSSSFHFVDYSPVARVCLDLDGGPVAASGEFKSTEIPNSFAFDGLRKVESADSSQSSVLIYGELINPDSLGPLSFQVTPHYFSKKSRFMDFSLNVPLEEGTFFDGVLDPRVRKFSVEIEDLDNTGLFTLALGDREVLAEYFIWPGDSLKIGLDLLKSSVVFGGPDAAFYEVQYLLNRARKEEELNEPRKLMLGSANSLLADSKNDSLWKAANESFGSKLSFQVYGKESLEQVLNDLLQGSKHLQKQLKILDSFRNDLDPGSYDLLKLEVYARHYGPLVSTLYRFYYNELPRFLSSVEIQDYKAKIEAVLMEMGMEEFQMDSKLISPSYLDLQLDRLTLLALVKQGDFGDLVKENFEGPLQDRILAGFLSANSKRYPDPAKVLESLGSGISHSPWKERVESLKNAVALGLDMIRLEGVDPEGNTWNSKGSSENPRLYYFYFSTCPHSAHYFEDYLYPFWKKEGSAMGLDLIAVSIDQDQNLWIENLPLFSSPEIPNYRLSAESKSQFSSFYEVSGYPFTLLVDSKGKVRSFKIPASNYLDFESKMTALLEAISVQEENSITEVEADSDRRIE
ncbi:thioredoxin family protein [uncultured Algoriphagus sp.]|uniref:thioredoxin family protein n=1 Tax=uncultured Algoriphagus sp. TaxID=417365 RepID=UPI00258FB20C|nr:thioredoxin family protein [uncultured Algoriphagus sp.]